MLLYHIPWYLAQYLEYRMQLIDTYLYTSFGLGFPGSSDGKQSACNVGDLGSTHGVGKIPWRKAWQPTPVFLPGESPWTEEPGGLQSMGSQKESDTTEHSTYVIYMWCFPVAQMIKNLPLMQETWVQSLGQEHSLEKGMATHSSILAWRIPWIKERGGL